MPRNGARLPSCRTMLARIWAGALPARVVAALPLLPPRLPPRAWAAAGVSGAPTAAGRTACMRMRSVSSGCVTVTLSAPAIPPAHEGSMPPGAAHGTSA
eukprot:366178-Chlamydomonas_euryale.AAC.10